MKISKSTTSKDNLLKSLVWQFVTDKKNHQHISVILNNHEDVKSFHKDFIETLNQLPGGVSHIKRSLPGKIVSVFGTEIFIYKSSQNMAGLVFEKIIIQFDLFSEIVASGADNRLVKLLQKSRARGCELILMPNCDKY